MSDDPPFRLTAVPKPALLPTQGTRREPVIDRRAGRQPGVLHLLLVEDSAADGRLVVELLREAGVEWQLERVDRVADAQRYVTRHHVDCVLLDLGLLDADGLDALRLMVTTDATVPVVVLTRRDDDVLSSEALRHGAQDYLPKRDLQAHVLTRSVRYAIERKSSELQLMHLAHHDPLTGLANRALFLRRLESALQRQAGAVTLFLDVDNLKLLNDSLGHAAGDALLMAVAQRLQGAVRPSDTVARFGGDEFAVVCPDLVDPVLAADLAARLMAEIGAPLLLGARLYVPSVSIGLALTQAGSTDTAEATVAGADRALYLAKQRGKARFEVFEQTPGEAGSDRLLLQTELRTALVEDQFRVHFQPEVSLRTGALVCVEALVRWEHPSRGLLTAAQFIDAVEEGGLAGQLGALVLRDACEALATWPTRSTPPRLAINISPRHFSMTGFVDQLSEVLRGTGLRADNVELEITESALLVNDRVAQVLRDVHALGVRLAVDDFGTGFSSLNHLKFFPASTVKIDQSFVAGLGRDPTDEAIVTAVIGVARSLGLSTVGEGVETTEQRDRLLSLGCELGQGYLFAKAMPAAELYARFA